MININFMMFHWLWLNFCFFLITEVQKKNLQDIKMEYKTKKNKISDDSIVSTQSEKIESVTTERVICWCIWSYLKDNIIFHLELFKKFKKNKTTFPNLYRNAWKT